MRACLETIFQLATPRVINLSSMIKKQVWMRYFVIDTRYLYWSYVFIHTEIASSLSFFFCLLARNVVACIKYDVVSGIPVFSLSKIDVCGWHLFLPL